MLVLSTSIFAVVSFSLVKAESCVTTADTPTEKATPNTACIFPFVFKNKTITGCLPDKATGKFWCSTKVEEGTKEHVKDNWGFCPSHCSIIGDTNCTQDRICTYKDDCPNINSEYERWKTLTKGKERKTLRNKLKSLICNNNKKFPRFCCPQQADTLRISDGSDDDQEFLDSELSTTQSPPETLPSISKVPKKLLFPASCQSEPTTNFLANILPSTGTCGLSCNPGSRVVNGENSKLGEFPWAALLGYQAVRRKYIAAQNKYVPEKFVLYKCGGTLINTWYVLTAAHCHGESASRSIHQVVLGEWEVSDLAFHNKDPDCIKDGTICMPPVQKILVDKVVVHDDYKKTRKGIFKDIALVRLKTEAVLNTGVQMACLPLDKLTMAAKLLINGFGSNLGGYDGTVIGWGHAENFNDGDLEKSAVPKSILQKAKVPLMSIEECQDIRSATAITEEHLCAGGGEDGADSCKGDSGGGIFIKKNTTNQAEEKAFGYVQVGLVSYGSQECGDGSPGVYTRVAEYIDWIKLNLEP